jgi:hypothetical protein
LIFEVGFNNYFIEIITITIEMTYPAQHVGPYLEVQCHSNTLQQNRVRPITLLFEVEFYRNDHHIQTTCRPKHLGCNLEGQGHSMTLQQNRVQSIISLFEVGVYNYFTEMITVLRRHVARKSVYRSHWVEVQCSALPLFGIIILWTLSGTLLWNYKIYYFLCPKPSREASSGSIGSCFILSSIIN